MKRRVKNGSSLCENFGKEGKTYVCDVSDEQKVNEITKDALSKVGKIDILVNNAGIFRDMGTFIDIQTSMWKKYIDVNLMGVVYFTKALLPQMIENNYGKIVNVASVAGVYGNANMVHYSATKGAVISMTKALAKEVIGKGVNVNAISPGSVSSSHVSEDINHIFLSAVGTYPASEDVTCPDGICQGIVTGDLQLLNVSAALPDAAVGPDFDISGGLDGNLFGIGFAVIGILILCPDGKDRFSVAVFF